MTTGILNGKLLRVYLGAVVISKATECSISFSSETREASHKDSGGWKESLPGMKSCSISTSGLHAEDSTTSVHDLFTSYDNQTPVTLSFTTDVTGDKFYTGSFVISQLEINAPNEENVTYSVSFENQGPVTQAQVA